jgi:hypothetical protein
MGSANALGAQELYIVTDLKIAFFEAYFFII